MGTRLETDGRVAALVRDEADWPAIKMVAALALSETGRFTEADIAAALSLRPETVGRMLDAGRAA